MTAQFPQAQAALERSGKPFDIQDTKARTQVEQAYVAMLEADTWQLTQPLVEHLQDKKYSVMIHDGLPSFTASLPKHVIRSLADRPDVGKIFLVEGEGRQLLDSAIESSDVPFVWEQGFDGTGYSIAILEDGSVDFTSNTWECPSNTNNCFRNPGTVSDSFLGDHYHATMAASAAASDHVTHKGVAPGATIHSAGMIERSRAGMIEALKWSLDPVPYGVHADVVNISYGFGASDPYMDWIDWAIDYWARDYNAMIVVASGNMIPGLTDWSILAPAKGWNVLSVGGYDDRVSRMYDRSCYVNPGGDREKPEVVAPAVSITTISKDGVFETRNGTSFAAPQVAGLATLLIQREPQLEWWPEANRAIIMASAVHNIEGPSHIPTGEELKDGAGGINATVAYTAAMNFALPTTTCTEPCWWGALIDPTSFDGNGHLYRYFDASEGKRIRAAISWWSNADCEGWTSPDWIRTGSVFSDPVK